MATFGLISRVLKTKPKPNVDCGMAAPSSSFWKEQSVSVPSCSVCIVGPRLIPGSPGECIRKSPSGRDQLPPVVRAKFDVSVLASSLQSPQCPCLVPIHAEPFLISHTKLCNICFSNWHISLIIIFSKFFYGILNKGIPFNVGQYFTICCTVLHNGSTYLHFHHQYTRYLLNVYPYKHESPFKCLIIVNLIHMQ